MRYVRDGELMAHSLGTPYRMGKHIGHLRYTWLGRPPSPVHYRAQLVVDNRQAVVGDLSIQRDGLIPARESREFLLLFALHFLLQYIESHSATFQQDVIIRNILV